MTTRQLIVTLPNPLDWQRQVTREARRFNVLAIGRRAGKTVYGQDRCADPAVLPYPVAWFSPTYKYMVEVWRDIANRFSAIITRQNATDRRLEFITGGTLEFWTLENQRAGTGRKYKRVIIDEAAFTPNLMDIWNYSIRPTLADMRGDAWFLSTPKGRNGFWQLWQYGQDELEPEWASWQMPSEVNPTIPRDELVAMRRQLPERVAAQELDAIFLEDAGGVFRNVMACATAAPIDAGIINRQYVMGVDWAYSNDFTCIAVVDTAHRSLVHLDRFNGIDYTMQRERIIALAERFRPLVTVAEENAMGRPNNEALRAAGLDVLDFTTSNASKQNIISHLAGAFERGDIAIIPDDVLINELQAYEGERLDGGMVRYGAPEGMHDDTVMALALAWYGATAGSNTVEVSSYVQRGIPTQRKYTRR